MTGADYLDDIVLKDEQIDFEKYLHTEDIAKLRDASTYREQVKRAFIAPEAETGARLPWQKAFDFLFRDAELTIWTGYNGAGKSVLLGFVQLALLAQGTRGCIASMEMPPRKTLMRMARQFAGNGDPTLPVLDQFFAWLHGKLWIYDQVGTVKAERMLAVARYAITELGVKDFVVDSLMKLDVGEDDYNRQKWIANELSTLAKDTGARIHLVAHSKKPENGKETVPSTKYSVSGSAHLTNMADNVLIVYRQKDETKDYDAMLICEKNRETGKEPKWLLHFCDDSQQFKPSRTSYRMTPEDWQQCRWME